MAVTFPPNPTVGQTVTDPVTGAVWVWNGTAWVAQGSAGAGAYLPIGGGTMTGVLNAFTGTAGAPGLNAGYAAFSQNVSLAANLNAAGMLNLPINGASPSQSGDITFNATYASSNWSYTANGYANIIQPAAGGGLAFYVAPSGTAGQPITWNAMLNISTAGVISGGAPTPAAAQTTPYLAAQELVLPIGGTSAEGNIAWNCYWNGSNWATIATGLSALLSLAPPNIAISVAPSVAAGGNVAFFNYNFGSNGNAVFPGTFTANGGYIISSGVGSSQIALLNTAGGNQFGIWNGSGNLVFGTTNAAGVPATAFFYLTPAGNLLTFNNMALIPSGDHSGQVGQAGTAWSNMESYAFSQASDPRLKKHIQDIPSAIDIIPAIRPKMYRYSHEPDDGPLHWGFLATDVREVMGAGFAGVTTGEDENRTQALAYNEMIAVLWRAVQELSAQVDALKAARG